ncbi:uncharacterized protein UV8b_06625 [Ustilaginoidea virens]|uniref:Uncharacterized protein n=1 Tax=Ustilaginoidea virens TaxID=1159556 RepID=A0A8E5HVG8_USTVR|nr:uncharacterized protein UV8b_06625 [Ustilaginoidea virens]QUC22384.1 hypothetical protein UV8b_06625 [Ustilaginoidea virens]
MHNSRTPIERSSKTLEHYTSPKLTTNTGPHPLLEQVPLTVSPFVSLPTATTLSYNYKTMPSNIPPSSLGIPTSSQGDAQQPKPSFVVSGSGHAAHPDDISASCRALLAHVTDLQQNAERELQEFEERVRQRDLAEKRRVAPGWLDSESKLLQPERKSGQAGTREGVPSPPPPVSEKGKQRETAEAEDQGAQLDRAFGGMALR